MVDEEKEKKKDETTESSNSAIEPTAKKDKEDPELEDLPKEQRHLIRMAMSQMKFSSGMLSPIVEKMNENHITKILEDSAKDDERSYEYAKSGRRWIFGYVALGLIVLLILIYSLVDKNLEFLTDLLLALVLVLGGIGAGIGIKSR